ncbi:hypothetical protein CBR_g41294 [Chara braunii]|uniref:DDE Tnp4 domain-containing protein n=1 Tax=Chara braunii TaxID=69332 RepID=A0A388LVF0_CHABU|nr:hypothetical protein CBR_g41294 [Chara braunii]|eukprot:GBG86300.1 hypothetical protein CBR_g41294 [Chara braunii]
MRPGHLGMVLAAVIRWVRMREKVCVLMAMMLMLAVTNIVAMHNATTILLFLAYDLHEGHGGGGAFNPLGGRGRRRLWVREQVGGTWEELNMEGLGHEKKFREYTRLTRPLFDEILERIAPRIQRMDTHYRQALPASLKFAFALYRWATGGYYRQCGKDFGLGRHSAIRCTDDVARALCDEYGHVLSWSTGDRLQKTLDYYEGKGFPGCFGVIDCTHILIDKPRGGEAEPYFDRNRQYSIVAQVVCDENLHILDVSVGAPGAVHDSRILRLSDLYNRGEEGREPFIRRTNVLIDGTVMGRYLMGDAGYPILPWLMIPFGGCERTTEERAFDNKFSALRSVIERCFGRLKGMWRCFGRKHIANMRNVCYQFFVCCILHNIIMDAGILVDEDLLRWRGGEDSDEDNDDDGPARDDDGDEGDDAEAQLRREGSLLYATHRIRRDAATALRSSVVRHALHVSRVFGVHGGAQQR